MKRNLLIALLIALCLMGIADSWYLAEHAAADTALVCDIGGGLDGCNTVAQSPYSRFLGVPLANFGVGFYTLFFLLTMLALFTLPRRLLYEGIFLLSVAGAVASIGFLSIQFFLIQAICVYCILSALLTFVSVPISHLLRKHHSPQTSDVLA